MFEGPHQLRSIILGPSLCAVLLGAMSLQGRQLSKLPDPEPFHRRAAEAINSIPLVIPPWMGREGEAEALRPEERSLLKPNAYRCIAFVDTRAAALSDATQRRLRAASAKACGFGAGSYIELRSLTEKLQGNRGQTAPPA